MYGNYNVAVNFLRNSCRSEQPCQQVNLRYVNWSGPKKKTRRKKKSQGTFHSHLYQKYSAGSSIRRWAGVEKSEEAASRDGQMDRVFQASSKHGTVGLAEHDMVRSAVLYLGRHTGPKRIVPGSAHGTTRLGTPRQSGRPSTTCWHD